MKLFLIALMCLATTFISAQTEISSKEIKAVFDSINSDLPITKNLGIQKPYLDGKKYEYLEGRRSLCAKHCSSDTSLFILVNSEEVRLWEDNSKLYASAEISDEQLLKELAFWQRELKKSNPYQIIIDNKLWIKDSTDNAILVKEL